jgi:hypothetical protein
MTLPATGGYATFTPALPSVAQTDWRGIGIITSAATDFWTEAENVNARQARFANDSGPAEIPGAPIYYDYASQVFVFAYKITMPTSSGPTIRVYPPTSLNSTYAASDTFGSDNAFDSGWEAFLPLVEDPEDSAPQFQDLTANGNHGTAGGTILNSQKTTGGPIDIAVNLNSNQYIEIGSGHGLTDQFSWSAWYTNSAGITVASPFPKPIYFDGSNYMELRTATRHNYGGTNTGNLNPNWSGSACMGEAIDSSGNGARYLDGVEATFTVGTPALTSKAIQFPQDSAESLDGTGEAMIEVHNVVRDADWMAYNYTMLDDIATYMGALSWTPGAGGGGNNVAGHFRNYQRMRAF